jgi:hypothetical protein
VAGFVGHVRTRPLAALAGSLVAIDSVLRLSLGRPYVGATLLLALACGLAAAPFLPHAVSRLSARIAAVPALGIVAFAVLLTTLSVLGVELTELSIRAVVAAFVAVLGAQAGPGTGAQSADRGDVLALAGLACVFAFALGAAWDVVGPFPPPGVDWGHYLLYAEEAAAEGKLLVDDRYAGEDGRVFADSPGVGAVYGGMLILDGVESSSLSYGVILFSAISPLTVFVAGASFWGFGAGLVAAGAYAVSPIHMDPIRWHGVGTTLALVFVPLLVLALGLMFRGVGDRRVSGLLAAGLVGVAVTHSTSAFVVVFLLAAALVVDAVRHVSGARSLRPRQWWSDGILRPLVVGVAYAGIGGAAVIVHLRAQAADLGSPVDYRLFEPDWLSWRVVEDYYSLVFLALTTVSLLLVLTNRTLRRDGALLAVAALVLACVVVAELWRIEVAFEYRRVVHYLAIALVLVVGAASLRFGRSVWTVVAYAALFAVVAEESVGLQLPQRILTERQAKGTSAEQLIQLRKRIDLGELPDASLLVADECVNFVVPYLLERPTLVAFEPWQVGFESRVPLAERAEAVLAGGPAGRRLAAELGVGYVVANPTCTPGLEEKLGGEVVVAQDGIVVIDVRRPAQGEST